MQWFVIIFLVIIAGTAIFAYFAWRREHPAAAARLEKGTKRIASATGKSAGAAARASASLTAKAVHAEVERRKNAKIPLRWIGPDSPIKVGGFCIERPMTYLGNPRAGAVDEPSALDSTARVQTPRAMDAFGLPYWPSYSHMTPGQRYAYLRWMSADRAEMPPEIGFAFVFFYGLERRALIEGHDFELITSEILRLRRLHTEEPEKFNRSFARYTSSFLWFLIAFAPTEFDEHVIDELLDTVRYWSEEQLAALLAWYQIRNEPLPAKAAFVIAGELPSSQRSVVTTRVSDQFRELFCKRYGERFSVGLIVENAGRKRHYIYGAASAAIGKCECQRSDPFANRKRLNVLSEIWNTAIEDLRKLSKIVHKEGDARLTPASWEALPIELRQGVDHPLTRPFCAMVSEFSTDDAHCLVPVANVAALLQLEQRDRYTPTQSKLMCQTAEFIGYGFEPDARLTGKGYASSQRVATYLRLTEEDTNQGRYNAAACMLRLGLGIAAADGHVHPDEVALVIESVEKWFDLNDEERRRIEALRSLLLAEGPHLKGLSQLTKKLNATQRQAIAQLLLALIAEDGVITQDEIRAVRKCFRSLDADERDIDAALARWQHLIGDQPVTVKVHKSSEGKGERIPTSPVAREAFSLDVETIRSIQRESLEAAQLLANAMETADEAKPGGKESEASTLTTTLEPTTTTIAPTSSGPGAMTLPARYVAFYDAIIAETSWPRSAAENVARAHGLMLGGAVEAVNDWSVDVHGSPLLIDYGEELRVQIALLEDESK